MILRTLNVSELTFTFIGPLLRHQSQAGVGSTLTMHKFDQSECRNSSHSSRARRARICCSTGRNPWKDQRKVSYEISVHFVVVHVIFVL